MLTKYDPSSPPKPTEVTDPQVFTELPVARQMGVVAESMDPTDEEKKSRLQLARDHLIHFTTHTFPQYQTDSFHEHVSADLTRVVNGEIKNLMLFAPPQHGKLCAHSTPVLTTKGWSTHGELRPGDYVYGRDGKPKEVLALSTESMATLEVEFTDGTKIKCHPNHEWQVYDRTKHSADRHTTFAYETKGMMRRGVWYGQQGKRGSRAKFQVDGNVLIEAPGVVLPIHPYVLGVWLGDGSYDKPCITYHPDDYPIITKFLATGMVARSLYVHSDTGIHTTYFEDFTSVLHDAEVWKAKHIPDIYYTAPLDDRLELLAGLIDSDGYVYQRNGRTVFSNTNERLVRDVVRMVATLGWRSTVSRAEPVMSSSGINGQLPVYQVTFNPTLPLPVALERKQNPCLNPKQRRRAIKSIRPCDPEPGRCIQVEGGVYLIGDTLIPTHNSELVSTRLPGFWLAHNPDLPVALVSYATTLAYRNSRNARSVFESPHYQELFPACRPDPSNWRVQEWHVDQRKGYVLAVGAGGPITGHGFGLGIIDDPIENWAAAQSEVQRESIWQWWLGTFKTRMWEGGSIIFMMCMPGDTRVMMADGTWRNLDTIRPGEKVMTKENDALVPKKVEAFLPQGKAQILEIRTGNHQVRATGNHPFLVETENGQEWRRADQLKNGDEIVTLGVWRGGTNHRQLSQEDCWLLGYMFGDGWITHHPRENGTMRWVSCVAEGENDEHTNKVLKYFADRFGVRLRYKPKARYYRSEVARIGRWLESLGLRGKAKKKRVPDLVFQLPLDLRIAFLEGFCDAHGYTDSSQRATLTSNNGLLIHDLKLLSESCGYRTSNINRQSGEYQPPGSPEPLWATLFRFSYSLTNRDTETFKTKKITGIRLAGVQPVYDLTVEDTHNFIAEGCVVHNTRWHEDDLAARILEQEGRVEEGGKWLVRSYPALADHDEDAQDILGRDYGEALAPSRYTRGYLVTLSTEVGPLVWSAEYQQKPSPPTGRYFKIARISILNHERVPLPDTLPSEIGELIDGYPVNVKKGVRFWDFAATEEAKSGRDPDWTSGTLMAENDAKYYVLDQFRERLDPEQVEQMVLQTAQLDGRGVKIRIEQEPGASGKQVISHYIKLLAGFDVEGVPSSGDKMVRAMPFAAQVNAGNVVLVKGEWNKAWLSEHAEFNMGKHDDQVDTSAGAFNSLAEQKHKWSRPKFAKV